MIIPSLLFGTEGSYNLSFTKVNFKAGSGKYDFGHSSNIFLNAINEK